jgi:FKBP-type peptidyl-prolyl cis-trans isomerase 2
MQVKAGDVIEIHYIGNVGDSEIRAVDWTPVS